MSSYLVFRYHGLNIRAFPFPGPLLVFLSEAILLVRLIGFPESRVESRDSQNFAALGDREPSLTLASLSMTCVLL